MKLKIHNIYFIKSKILQLAPNVIQYILKFVSILSSKIKDVLLINIYFVAKNSFHDILFLTKIEFVIFHFQEINSYDIIRVEIYWGLIECKMSFPELRRN